MKIINGRWMKDEDTPIDNFNVTELMEIGKKVTSLYGNEITYDRIALVNSLQSLDSHQEAMMSQVLNTSQGVAKLAGF